MPREKEKYSRNFSSNPFHSFLNKFVIKNYDKWRDKYLNIVGADIGKKMKGRKILNAYSIIFHVLDKTDAIEKKHQIPKYFKISFRGKKIKVLTDIRKTGESKLHYITPGQNLFQYSNSSIRGTIGLIVTKNGEPYVLSNMHVLGWSYLSKTMSVIDKPINLNLPPDTSCLLKSQLKPVGYFRSGVVNSEIDAAIALIPPSLYNQIDPRSDIIDITDPLSFPNQPVNSPIAVLLLGNVSGFKKSYIVSTTAVRTFNYPLKQQTLVNLIALKPCCSLPGDSGAAVIEPSSGRIIGIIIGTDDQRVYSYVIPYLPIQNALSFD